LRDNYLNKLTSTDPNWKEIEIQRQSSLESLATQRQESVKKNRNITQTIRLKEITQQSVKWDEFRVARDTAITAYFEARRKTIHASKLVISVSRALVFVRLWKAYRSFKLMRNKQIKQFRSIVAIQKMFLNYLDKMHMVKVCCGPRISTINLIFIGRYRHALNFWANG